MDSLKVYCKAKSGCFPSYKSAGAAGADLVADIEGPLQLKPGERQLISTGLWVHLPGGYEAQVRSRSGLAIQYGVTVLNSPGTIDSDYRGEIKVILANFGSSVFSIKRGDRIAQLVFNPIVRADFELREALGESVRGSNGFGSTGV